MKEKNKRPNYRRSNFRIAASFEKMKAEYWTMVALIKDIDAAHGDTLLPDIQERIGKFKDEIVNPKI